MTLFHNHFIFDLPEAKRNSITDVTMTSFQFLANNASARKLRKALSIGLINWLIRSSSHDDDVVLRCVLASLLKELFVRPSVITRYFEGSSGRHSVTLP